MEKFYSYPDGKQNLLIVLFSISCFLFFKNTTIDLKDFRIKFSDHFCKVYKLSLFPGNYVFSIRFGLKKTSFKPFEIHFHHYLLIKVL